ncbi:MAG: asparagine synthase (glutamine-hydrolyzing) [Candidatus Galacturonibacter soehngenii]|nr:asparagine synthase (glutamine-hydrolyzing) [Candidatus Galacturonibacter soehngenii]
MCGIAGFFNPYEHYSNSSNYYNEILTRMNTVQKHRGPDDDGTYLSDAFAFAHVRLSIIDLAGGHQPMTRTYYNSNYTIVYNGELYNTIELREDLKAKGHSFFTSCDTEVILIGFIEYGPSFVQKLNGIFAFAISDERKNELYLFRDRFGIKPLFYTQKEDTLIFSSEIKGIFEHPFIQPEVDINGLNEIFSIGPAKTPGLGVFKGINEVLPGYYCQFGKDGLHLHQYWQLEAYEHTDSLEETVAKTSFLIQDSIKRQMVSDIPICTFLSGGLDSSIVSAVCANELKKKNKQLSTFSFDFVNNNRYFKSNSFQPSQDRPWAEKMAKFLDSKHIFLECDKLSLAEKLKDSVRAHDLPSMADVDSSMLYFCSLVKEYNAVTLTGECADEIFGGYPWFHKEECFQAQTFPWTMNLEPRKALLKDDFLNELNMDEYVQKTYEESISQTPHLYSENKTESRRREISFLNIKWFMQTLLTRMDRCSMYSGLEARVPFADHRLAEYVFNVPWSMKYHNEVVKSLLREASIGLLPEEVLFRKKSPYPKTYDPGYESLLAKKLIEVIEEPSSPLLQFIDKAKVYFFINTPSDYGSPWYGQLMAAPQLIAYMLMINDWLLTYKVKITI